MTKKVIFDLMGKLEKKLLFIKNSFCLHRTRDRQTKTKKEKERKGETN